MASHPDLISAILMLALAALVVEVFITVGVAVATTVWSHLRKIPVQGIGL